MYDGWIIHLLNHGRFWKELGERERIRVLCDMEGNNSKRFILFPVSLSKTERLSNNVIVKLKTVYKEKCKT